MTTAASAARSVQQGARPGPHLRARSSATSSGRLGHPSKVRSIVQQLASVNSPRNRPPAYAWAFEDRPAGPLRPRVRHFGALAKASNCRAHPHLSSSEALTLPAFWANLRCCASLRPRDGWGFFEEQATSGCASAAPSTRKHAPAPPRWAGQARHQPCIFLVGDGRDGAERRWRPEPRAKRQCYVKEARASELPSKISPCLLMVN